MLKKLRSFAPAGYDLDEMVELSSFGRILRAEYEALGVEVPADIDAQIKAVRREVKDRQRDAIESRLAAARSRLDALKTPDEKREALRKEIEQLEALTTA